VLRRAWRGVPPETTGDRSRMERGTDMTAFRTGP
jgi:hypothetical protein